MSLTVYAIPNCNTVKKARAWLEENGVEYEFHDYKKHGASADKLQAWVEEFGWEKVVNRAGMTWRKLSDEEKAAITDNAAAIELMQAKTSIIKRPIIEGGAVTLLGFKESEYAESLIKVA